MCDECISEPLNYDEIFSVPLGFKLKPKTLLDTSVVDPEKQELEECEDVIRLTIKYSESKFLTLGEALVKIRDKKLYRKSKYPTFELYILNTFEMSKMTAYRIIKVYEYTKSNTGVTFENYSFSQLLELTTIPEEDSALLAQINASMSKREIQRLKHNYFTLKQKQNETESQPNIHVPNKVAKSNKFEDFCSSYEEAQKAIDYSEIQPLVLKNKEERLTFLKGYQSCELISNIDYLKLKIYRRKLKNKTAVIALSAERFDNKQKNYPSVKYSLFFEPGSSEPNDYRFNNAYFNLWFNSETEIVDYLTKHKKEIE